MAVLERQLEVVRHQAAAMQAAMTAVTEWRRAQEKRLRELSNNLDTDRRNVEAMKAAAEALEAQVVAEKDERRELSARLDRETARVERMAADVGYRLARLEGARVPAPGVPAEFERLRRIEIVARTAVAAAEKKWGQFELAELRDALESKV